MREGIINDQILMGIRKTCKNDPLIEEFLIGLIYEEVNSSGRWHWKDKYREKIKEYSEKWDDSYEN